MKANRLVDDSQGEKPYQRIDALHWTVSEETTGKVVKLYKFPKHHYETGQTLYQVKHGMFSKYLRQQLKSPMLKN